MGRVIPNLEVHQEEVLPDAAACVGQFRRNTIGLWWSDGVEWRRVDAPGGVQSVIAGTGVEVDGTDPANPKVSLDSATIASLALADTAVQNLSDLGVTATASELNVLDGITASTAELNYTSGVTSNIQTQLDGRMLWLGQVTDGVYDDHVVRSSAAAFFHAQGNAPSDRPISSQASVLHLGNTWGRAQLVFPNSGTNRVFVRTGTNTDWSEIYTTTNLNPAEFASVDHSHTIGQITGLQDALDGKANASHTHEIADITGLQGALDGKQPVGSYAAASHTHTIADVVNLQSSLDALVARTGVNWVTGDFRLMQNTAEGSDTGVLRFASGGGWSVNRGALLELNGANASANASGFRLLAAGASHISATAGLTISGPVTSTGNIHVGKGTALITLGADTSAVSGGIANYGSSGVYDIGLYAEGAGTIRLRPNGRNSTVGQVLVTTSGVTIGGNAVWHAGTFDPASKANASHTHTADQLSGVLKTGYHADGDFNALTEAGAYRFDTGNPNGPPVSHAQVLVVRGWGDTLWQMVVDYNSSGLYFRGANNIGIGGVSPTWWPWRSVWHSGNFTPSDKWDSSEATARGLTGTQGRTVTDWNELLGQGSQFVRGTGSSANAPFGNAATGIYSAYNTQAGLVLAASGSQNEFYGRAASGGSWKDWRRFAMADELGLVPQRASNASTTLTLADAGRHIFSGNNTNYTWTVPPNSSVAFPIGTVVSFVHGGSSGTKTVAQGSGVTFIHQDGSTGNVALTSTRRSATLLKVDTNTWLVS